MRPDLEDDMSPVGPMIFELLGEKLLEGAADGLVREICRYFIHLSLAQNDFIYVLSRGGV